MNSKLKYEPYYKNLTEEQAFSSGYFTPDHDEINWKLHTSIPCTPISFLKTDVSKPAVLISTGGFCPLHESHISSLKQAGEYVSTLGYDVIGHYLSPGHDNYIKEKAGDNYMSIHKRIKWANNLLKDKRYDDTFAIDPWEGIFAPGSVNFTSVVYRLKLYLQKFYTGPNDVKIFFVCGGDNARFVIPFLNTDIGCIVIKRRGYHEIFEQYLKHANGNDIHFELADSDESSTNIRKTEKYKEFNKISLKQLHVRVHESEIEKAVVNELKNWFTHTWTENYDEQVAKLDVNKYVKDDIILNLDVESNHGIKFDVSRLYDFFGQTKLGFTNRPGTLTLKKQIEKILTKKYFNRCVLFDDDICTGRTMDFVESILNELGIKVNGRFSFISGYLKEKEVLDAKDFILGYDTGGLVVKFNDDLVRLPYIYPFVDPYVRASINDPLQFSINMWKINMELWENKPVELQNCKDLKYLIKLGHNKKNTIYDVCKYYYELLIQTKTYYK